MSHPIILLVKTFLLTLGLCFLSSPSTFADDNFYSQNVRLERGGIQGEICNKSYVFRDEVIMKMTAVKRSGEEIWHEYAAVPGLGPYQCRSFFKTRRDIEKGFDLKFKYYPGNSREILAENDDRRAIVFREFKVVNRELNGEVCNATDKIVDGLKINAFAVDNREKVRWNTFFFIDEIRPERCEKISRHVVGAEINRLFDFFFSIEKAYQNENFQSGRVTDNLSYKEIAVKFGYLTGQLCNEAAEPQEDIFVRFYNMRGTSRILWNRLVAISRLEPGECGKFSEEIPRDKKPARWKFTATGR